MATATTTVTVRERIGGAPMFQYDVANTGHTPDQLGPTASVTERWTFQTGGEVGSSPAVVDTTVYIGSDESIYAVDAATGEQQWQTEISGFVADAPTVVDGNVYFGSVDGTVCALNGE